MKKLTAIIVSAALCFSFAACGNPKPTGKQPTATDVVTAVAAQVEFKDTMSLVDEKLFSNFYRLDEEKVADRAMYTGSRATAEEVTVIRMKNEADVQLAKDAMAERLEDQRIAYENYVPEELPKIENAAIYSQGAYVILVVANDTSKVEKTFLAQF